ncbi:MAG: Hsp20/alpha crystallin family protein [Chloroflexi bacterium]|nr:Hsp20/alpha crystallin family protein [Chloroflexota bacterium]
MSLTRWEPFTEMMSLRDAVNRLFEESFVRPLPTPTGMFVPCDVGETEDEFICRCTLPGVRPEDCDISIQQNTIRITGELFPGESHEMQRQAQAGQQQAQQPMPYGGKKVTWLLREIPHGRFTRTITVPTPINADQAKATFDNGLLVLHLPKAEEAKAKRLTITPGAQQQAQIGKGGQPR